MVSSIAGTSYSTNIFAEGQQQTRIIPRELTVESRKDMLVLGKGDPVSTIQAMNVVVERALDKLRSLVNDAREALGISADAQIDTSPEATGNRIADFALGAFDKWRSNHKDLTDDDAREQFVSFIGSAVLQGISEARGILNALNVLNQDVSDNIDKTWEVVAQRFNKFLANEQS